LALRQHKKITIIVPCWNEEESLPHLYERLHKLVFDRTGWEVLFVNDGSYDRTAELLEQGNRLYPWARAVHHDGNKGLGAAIRTGLAHSREADIVCMIDSDGTYPPESLPHFEDLIRNGADVVTASPWHPDNRESDGGFHRILLSRGVSICYRLITGTQLYTYTALFRAYRRSVLDGLQFESNGFPAVTEILIRLLGRGCKVAEVPMPLKPREHGESKMTVWKAIRGHLRLLTLSAQWAKRI
jgi:dolichol-phosphate mannosyltransferase